MKIIKQGHLPSNEEIYNIFKCKKCGCIFEADKDEYTYNFVYDVSIISCPCCNKLVEANGPGMTREEIKAKNMFFNKYNIYCKAATPQLYFFKNF